MTTKELIEALQRADPEGKAVVCAHVLDGGYTLIDELILGHWEYHGQPSFSRDPRPNNIKALLLL